MTTEIPAISELLDLSGEVALVTGASGGIGRAIALRLAEAGAKVGVHFGANQSGAEAVAEEIARRGGTAAIVPGSLTHDDTCDVLIQFTTNALGIPTILVNNAGVQPVTPLAEISEEEWVEVFAVNLRAAHLLTQDFVRRLKGPGAVVNVASIEGLNPAAGHGHYAASKAGLLMLTRSQALEFGRQDVRVNAVSPGLIHREGIEADWPEGVGRWQEAAPMGRLGEGMDVADAVLFLVSRAARWITGANLVVDGGVTARPTW
ncbi:MAG: SDR family oxidoreductase [Alphaproteobacteria bacterium]|nr:MAG: SDR family oxidoreductase [Alphaproteobacteria bacterium]